MSTSRTILITGACHEAGAAVCRALAGAGDAVLLADRDATALEKLAADTGALAVPTDLASPVSVRRLVEQTLGAFGRLDVAVNLGDGIPLAMAYEIPPMRRAGRGRVVNLAATAEARKQSREAALACASTGVSVNAVVPGPHVAAVMVRLCSIT